MATITEDYCSFEVAKLLKEKGFEGECIAYYSKYKDNNLNLYRWRNKTTYVNVRNNGYTLVPTQQMAMKWLREVHGLHISLEPCYDYDSMHVVFLAFVQNVADVHEFFDGRKNVASYPNAEKSYELAIKYCLENLI